MDKSLKLRLLTTVMAFAVPYVGSAYAADVAPADYSTDWTGFYLGAQFGGGAVVNNIELPALGAGNFNGIGGEGVLGSVMAGYNVQMNNIVFGLQGEVGYNNLSTKLNIPGLATIDAQQGLVAALSARAGLLVTPDTLAYGIGGFSYSDYKADTSFLGTFNENYNGFHVGGGLETKISPNATIRVEYRYTKYNAKDWGTGGLLTVDPSTHTGTVGLAWNFGDGSTHVSQAADVARADNSTDWTGFYLGAQFGGGAVVNNIELPGLGSGNFNGIGGEGVLGSAMAGYNVQMNDIVFGLQGEVGYNNLSTTLNIPGLVTIDAQQGLVAALSARAGLLVTPDTLAYAIGGYSYSEYKSDTSFLGTFDEKYNGFHVGGGLETKISPNATVRVEYRYTKYNAKDWGTGGLLNVEPSTHTGTVGLAYSF